MSTAETLLHYALPGCLRNSGLYAVEMLRQISRKRIRKTR